MNWLKYSSLRLREEASDAPVSTCRGDDPADLVGQCPDHRTYDLGGVGVVALPCPLDADPVQRTHDPVPLLAVERQAGMLLDLQEKLCQQFEVDIDPLDEFLLAENGVHAGVLHRLDLQDAAGQVHEKRPLANRVARHARSGNNRTFRTKNDRKGIETCRIPEQVDVEFILHIDTRSDQASIVIEVFRPAAADVEQCGEREALNLLFVHFTDNYADKYTQIPGAFH